jgi:hypothetical protein
MFEGRHIRVLAAVYVKLINVCVKLSITIQCHMFTLRTHWSKARAVDLHEAISASMGTFRW